MKNLRLIFVVFLVVWTMLLSGCARNVKPEFNSYPLLYCGWLDLKESEYKKVGYNSRAEWKIIIERINIYFLQKYIADYCSTFKVVGATKKGDKPPANSYHIKFNVIEFDPAGTSMTVGIKIIDTDTGKVVSSFTSRPSGIQSFASTVFMGRISHLCMGIANDIYYKIYTK
ncbi:MAG: hypothetical protein ABFD75_02925 [Smithella sp.]